MLNDIDFPNSEEYRTGTENEPLSFYLECLLESKRLDLLLGYFSSSAIHVLSLGFAKFISNGGRTRLIINHILSGNDKNALIVGNKSSESEYQFSVQNYQELKSTLDEYGTHFFECLAWLIASKRLDIRVVKPITGKGISHYKSGIFSDGSNKVKFKGSCNFTASGLLENLEELDVKLSWKSHKDTFVNYERDYQTLFDGKADYAISIPYENIETIIHQDYGGKELDELLIDEQALIKKKAIQSKNAIFKRIVEKAQKKIEMYLHSPRFPYESGPREYQKEAYQNWIDNNSQGIFAMATGTGKTITSLNCVLNEHTQKRVYQAVIVVPTTVLVEQWEKECKKFNFREIIKVSSKSKNWITEIDRIQTQISFGIDMSFVVIVTYASFTKPKFQGYFQKLPKETILIADEAHNIASASLLGLLDSIHLKKRIGLSATPKRIYDPKGSIKMEAFFNDQEPYTYNFSMERAISEGILCQYYYHPKLVELSPDEMAEYTKITNQLVKFYSSSKNNLEANSIVEQLLMKRKRIIHKAQGKLNCFTNILENVMQKQDKLKYTLVYAPEGFYSDEEVDDERFPDFNEENRIIDFYSSIVRNISPQTTITQYTSESEDKETTLKQFENGEIDVLLSMKCLDEGVDIPRTEMAIFCSSTGNPRQFIQRRGRILRKHESKNFAYIYDMVVIPMANRNSPNFDLERNLVQKELERVVHFAYMAINKYEAVAVFKDLCNHYDLNLDTIHLDLVS